MQDQNIDAFLNEVARLLSVLPPAGLVLDVRGNGGGYVIAAEFLLQFLSPRRITPEPFQFVSTPTTTGLAKGVADYGDWKASLEEAVTTGSAYSTAFPLYPADVVNSVGQVYQGPVVLVTDAQCYSACDIFAAGFQDHEIGPVLGVERQHRRRRRERRHPRGPAHRVDRRPAQAAAQGRADARRAAPLPAGRRPVRPAGGGPRRGARRAPRADEE